MGDRVGIVLGRRMDGPSGVVMTARLSMLAGLVFLEKVVVFERENECHHEFSIGG